MKKIKIKKTLTQLLDNKKMFLGIVAMIFFSVITAIAVYASSGKDVSDKVINKLTIPNLKGDIQEDFDPGVSVGTKEISKKNITIKNSGNINLFVRILVIPEIESSEGIQLPANIRKTDINGKTTGQIELVGLDKDVWLDGSDDYFYYSKKLEPKETSKPLFTGIRINESVLTIDSNPSNDNEVYYFSYGDSKLKISIKEETITSQGNTYQSAWNMKDTKGNFLTPELEEINKILDKEKE